MKSEAINIAIAKLRGWKKDAIGNWAGPHGEYMGGPPDFDKDLNACEDFEKFLHSRSNGCSSEPQPMPIYRIKLAEIVAGHLLYSQGQWNKGSHWNIAASQSATALQRCEAFLRTHNEWIEDVP